MFRSERYLHPWRMAGRMPPHRIETPRLVLRCWEPADAPLFESAIRLNREHVGAWIPPVFDEPSDLTAIEGRLARFRAEFHAGVGFVYAILDSTETQVLGEAGLMPRRGPRVLELGYWIHVDHVGRGLATEASHALTRAGLALPEVDRIEIHCDPRNAPSAAVPRKLGYRLVAPLHSRPSTSPPQVDHDTLVFALESVAHGRARPRPGADPAAEATPASSPLSRGRGGDAGDPT